MGDLNEYNFIIDKEGKLKVIDLDSASIEGLEGVEKATLEYYLMRNPNLKGVRDKYEVLPTRFISPNKNSDMYSYDMIILSTLANEPLHRKDLNSYYEYLDYLKKIGISQELIDIFHHVYTSKENENPRSYLESIPESIIEKADYKVFEKSI